MAVNVCTHSTSAADAAPKRPLALVAALPVCLSLATDTDTTTLTLPATALHSALGTLPTLSPFSMPATR
jgi:hypothetical protein